VAIPKPVFDPPFNVVRFSHLECDVVDLEEAGELYRDVIGLAVSSESPRGMHLRGMEERNHHSLVLRRAQAPVARALGFKVHGKADLDRAEEFFGARGLEADWVERSRMGRVLRVRDPWGVPLEFYAEMDRLPPTHQKYAAYKGVKPLRIDHVNLFMPDVDSAVEFYAEIGFRITEYTEDPESGRIWAAWMHRKGSVHDIAFTNGKGPRVHHIAYWVPSPLSIIDLLDIMSTSGHLEKIERGPGRHGISNAFFLYVRDADGHRTEFYCSDYLTVDPEHEPIKWDLQDPTRQTLWGAPAPRTWFEEGMEFAGVEPVDPEFAGTPIIAP